MFPIIAFIFVLMGAEILTETANETPVNIKEVCFLL